MQQIFNLGRIISDEEADSLASVILKAKEDGALADESKNPAYYKNSFGGVTEGTHDLLKRFTPLVRALTRVEVEPANPFSRIYQNQSVLRPHLDRPGLDWTISLCLYTNLDNPWPLKAQLPDGTIAEFPTIKGEGNLVNGRAISHWREPLICDPDKYVVQIFLHWSAPSPV
jgi:hypothetical protein